MQRRQRITHAVATNLTLGETMMQMMKRVRNPMLSNQGSGLHLLWFQMCALSLQLSMPQNSIAVVRLE